MTARKRKKFSRKERDRHFKRLNGVCYLCEGAISVAEAWDIEHVIPWEISRDDTDENLKLAHVKCHRPKTAKDRKNIAKCQRVEAKHTGAIRPKQTIKSRGFERKAKAEKLPVPGPRRLYETAE